MHSRGERTVGSVGVQQKRVTAVTLEGRLAVHQGNGHLGPIFCRGPQPLRDVVVPATIRTQVLICPQSTWS